MCALETQQTQWLQTRQQSRVIAPVEQASLLEMPENEFSNLISQLENAPLFTRLHGEEKLIRCQRYPRTDISSHFYDLNEGVAVDTGSADAESVLVDRQDVDAEIQKMGLEQFEPYVLYPESGFPSGKIFD
jgi:hypothetical protein